MVTMPKDKLEAEAMLASLGKIELALQDVELTRDTEAHEAIAKAQNKADETAGPLIKEFEDNFKALKRYADKHRNNLTDGGGKTISWTNGTFGWRASAAGIKTDGKRDVIVERILALVDAGSLPLMRFLREKYELNIEAMEAEHEAASAIEGISYSPGGRETFFVRFPFPGTEDIRRAIRALKKLSDKPPKEKG